MWGTRARHFQATILRWPEGPRARLESGKARRSKRGTAESSDRELSTGIERGRMRQAEPELQTEFPGLGGGMSPPVQMAQTVKAFDDQRQQGEQPDDHQAVRLMPAEVLQPVTILGVLKP